MRTTAIALVAALLLVGAAAPAIAQNDTTDLNETFDNDSDDFENETEEEENETEENETEEFENETERDQERDRERPENPQFDARLMTAINTVEALVEMAPSDEAEEGLQSALEDLKEVQEETNTTGPGDQERERDEERDQANRTNASEQAEEPGPPEDRGPSENSNRPGFVSNMLSGIFG